MLVFRKFCVRTKCMVSYIFNVMGVVSTFIQFYVISLLYPSIFFQIRMPYGILTVVNTVFGWLNAIVNVLWKLIRFCSFLSLLFIHFHIDLLIFHYQKNTGCKFHEKQVICPAGKSLNIIANKGLFQGFFSECEQICRYLCIGFHLLKKWNFIMCEVYIVYKGIFTTLSNI